MVSVHTHWQALLPVLPCQLEVIKPQFARAVIRLVVSVCTRRVLHRHVVRFVQRVIISQRQVKTIVILVVVLAHTHWQALLSVLPCQLEVIKRRLVHQVTLNAQRVRTAPMEFRLACCAQSDFSHQIPDQALASLVLQV